MNRIGTCSECGGSVVVNYNTDNVVAYCESCARIPCRYEGPIVPMSIHRVDRNVLIEAAKLAGYGWEV